MMSCIYLAALFSTSGPYSDIMLVFVFQPPILSVRMSLIFSKSVIQHNFILIFAMKYFKRYQNILRLKSNY